MRRVVVGVMGPGAQQGSGDEFERLLQAAVDLGEAVARQGWALLTGGRAEGVMDAASRGADRAGGLVVGVLPGGDEADVSPHVHIAIKTDMGSARNNINVLSSDVVIACGLGPGTASEVCLALKAHKAVILLMVRPEDYQFFSRLSPGRVHAAQDVDEAISMAREWLKELPQSVH